jgi:hypothetical protein
MRRLLLLVELAILEIRIRWTVARLQLRGVVRR